MSQVFNNINSNQIAIGIDFGTVNSSIAAFINDKVEILADSDGNKSISSAVKFAYKEFQTVSKNDLAFENTIHSKDFQV
jgi:molecular chaperone DnaK (HSP70)